MTGALALQIEGLEAKTQERYDGQKAAQDSQADSTIRCDGKRTQRTVTPVRSFVDSLFQQRFLRVAERMLGWHFIGADTFP